MKVYGELEKAQLELLASDPTGVDLYEGRIWLNTAQNLVKHYDGVSVKTLLPNSTDLTVSSGTKILSSGVHIINNLTVASGATLKINDSQANPCVLYIMGDADISGTIDYSAASFHDSKDYIIPLLHTTITPSVSQSAGGAGGNGGAATGAGGAGGAGNSLGFGGGGGGGGAISIGGTSAAGGAGGAAGSNGGNGAIDASGTPAVFPTANPKGYGVDLSNIISNPYQALADFTFNGYAGNATSKDGANGNSDAGGGDGSGGGGGGGRCSSEYLAGLYQLAYGGCGGAGSQVKGTHGGVVALYVQGTVSGSGEIDVSGSAGISGGDGGDGYCNRSGISSYAAGGGGGGGGAAGGSGGHAYIYYRVADTFTASGTQTVSGGAGGAGGAGGIQDDSGANGAAGTAGTAGVTGSYTSTQLS